MTNCQKTSTGLVVFAIFIAITDIIFSLGQFDAGMPWKETGLVLSAPMAAISLAAAMLFSATDIKKFFEAGNIKRFFSENF